MFDNLFTIGHVMDYDRERLFITVRTALVTSGITGLIIIVGFFLLHPTNSIFSPGVFILNVVNLGLVALTLTALGVTPAIIAAQAIRRTLDAPYTDSAALLRLVGVSRSEMVLTFGIYTLLGMRGFLILQMGLTVILFTASRFIFFYFMPQFSFAGFPVFAGDIVLLMLEVSLFLLGAAVGVFYALQFREEPQHAYNNAFPCMLVVFIVIGLPPIFSLSVTLDWGILMLIALALGAAWLVIDSAKRRLWRVRPSAFREFDAYEKMVEDVNAGHHGSIDIHPV
jgi:hypothetical protein